MSNTDNKDSTGYYAQGEAAVAAGGNRMTEGLQDTSGLTQPARSTEDALAATFDTTPVDVANEPPRSDPAATPSTDQEGTYIGFADADTVPGNVEGWAGANNLADTDDEG